MYGVAAVRPSRVVEIDYIEFRLYRIPVQVVQEVVVGNGREAGKFEIVNVLTVSLFDLLLDIGIDHGIGFSAARRTQHDGGTLRQHNVDPAVMPLFFVVKAHGQVHGVFVGQQTRLLHEGFILVIERVVHEVVLQ